MSNSAILVAVAPTCIGSVVSTCTRTAASAEVHRAAGADMEMYHLRYSTAVNLEMVGCTTSREQRLTQENPDAIWRNHYGLLQQNPAFKLRLATLQQKLSTEEYEPANGIVGSGGPLVTTLY